MVYGQKKCYNQLTYEKLPASNKRMATQTHRKRVYQYMKEDKRWSVMSQRVIVNNEMTVSEHWSLDISAKGELKL